MPLPFAAVLNAFQFSAMRRPAYILPTVNFSSPSSARIRYKNVQRSLATSRIASGQPVGGKIPTAAQKLKILLKFFFQISKYKRPAGSYPMRDFHEIYSVGMLLHVASAVKIWIESLKGLQSYGGFFMRVSGFAQIFSFPSGETIHQTPKRIGGTKSCSTSSIVMPSLDGIGLYLEFFICMFVCSSPL